MEHWHSFGGAFLILHPYSEVLLEYFLTLLRLEFFSSLILPMNIKEAEPLEDILLITIFPAANLFQCTQ